MRIASEKIGRGSEAFAVHAGGQELPMHDSRLDPSYAVAYKCEPTPGRHTVTSYQDIDLRSGKKLFPEVRQILRYLTWSKEPGFNIGKKPFVFFVPLW